MDEENGQVLKSSLPSNDSKENKNKIILNCTLCSAIITRILLKYTLWLQSYNNIIADNK